MSCGALCAVGRRRDLGWSANRGFSNEDGTGFDRERLGLDVTDDLSTGLQFDPFGGGEIAVNLAIDDDGSGFDFSADAGVLADGEIAIRGDFSLDLAVNDEIIGEFDGSFDFDIRRENVAGWPWSGATGCCLGLLRAIGWLSRGWLRVAGIRNG